MERGLAHLRFEGVHGLYKPLCTRPPADLFFSPHEGLKEGNPAKRARPEHPVEGDLPDAPRWAGYRPLEAYGVERVCDHPKVCKGVPYLLPVVEPYPADHGIGDAFPNEFLLKDPGLGVGPVENGGIPVA